MKHLNYSEKDYTTVCEKLSALCEKQNAIKQRRKSIEIEYSERLLQLDAEVEEKIKNNKEQEIRLCAFIDIAKAHASKLEDNGESEIYDTGVLSRLTVQINNGSCNDVFAEQLFTHASYQLRNVRAAVQRIYSWKEKQKFKLEKLRKEKKNRNSVF